MVGAPPEASLRCTASAKASELGGPAREARHLCPQTPDATPGLFSQVTHRPQRPHWGVLGKAQDEAKFMRDSAWQWASGRYIGFLPPNCQRLPAKEHQDPPGVGQVRATAHCSPGNAHHGEAQGVSGTGYQERFIRNLGQAG